MLNKMTLSGIIHDDAVYFGTFNNISQFKFVYGDTCILYIMYTLKDRN